MTTILELAELLKNKIEMVCKNDFVYEKITKSNGEEELVQRKVTIQDSENLIALKDAILELDNIITQCNKNKN